MNWDDTREVLEEYERAGWVIVALPRDVAEAFVGRPIDQRTALEFSARLREKISNLERAAGE
jgi:hypothetical protein